LADQSYHESQIKLTHNNSVDDLSVFAYDNNGAVKSVTHFNSSMQVQTGAEQVTKNRSFITDSLGNVVARADGVAGNANQTLAAITPDKVREAGGSNAHIRHILVVDGKHDGFSEIEAGPNEPVSSRFDFGMQSTGGQGDAPMHYMLTHSDVALGSTVSRTLRRRCTATRASGT
jgi:hypothetical protein